MTKYFDDSNAMCVGYWWFGDVAADSTLIDLSIYVLVDVWIDIYI